MIPAAAATQKTRRRATSRSYSGNAVRRWRTTKAIPAASATAARPAASAPSPGTGARLMASTRAATSTTERTPPRSSTGSEVSWTWLGTYTSARARATAASGRVTRKTAPHQTWSSSAPADSGPSAAMAPPMPDHSAMALVRRGPAHSAVTRASVVGKARPADTPPARRATASTPTDGAQAASTEAGTASTTPSTSIYLRPWRSPSAPR